MHFFWGNIFEYFKDRRGPVIFIWSLLGFGGLLVAGDLAVKAVGVDNLQEYSGDILMGVAIVFLGYLWRVIRQARARWRDRYKSSPLSRDELRKARSKLMRAKQ